MIALQHQLDDVHIDRFGVHSEYKTAVLSSRLHPQDKLIDSKGVTVFIGNTELFSRTGWPEYIFIWQSQSAGDLL